MCLSLLSTTYDRKAALDPIRQTVERQSVLPEDSLVQEDPGFRLSGPRLRAIAPASGDHSPSSTATRCPVVTSSLIIEPLRHHVWTKQCHREFGGLVNHSHHQWRRPSMEDPTNDMRAATFVTLGPRRHFGLDQRF
jgi:hypothetical protein